MTDTLDATAVYSDRHGAVHSLPDAEADEVLDLRKMTEIGVPGGAHGMVAGG